MLKEERPECDDHEQRDKRQRHPKLGGVSHPAEHETGIENCKMKIANCELSGGRITGFPRKQEGRQDQPQRRVGANRKGSPDFFTEVVMKFFSTKDEEDYEYYA
jgi:hypothetical protein